MQFGVIHTVMVPAGESVSDYYPWRWSKTKKLWNLTEMGREPIGDGEKWHQRKWCALLTEEQFNEYVDRCSMFAESTPTMGAIGGPANPYGWAPAVSFRADRDREGFEDAYVSPCGSRSEVRAWMEKHGFEAPSLLTDSVDQTYIWPEAVVSPCDAICGAVAEVYGPYRDL
jgi:hypothetical protein